MKPSSHFALVGSPRSGKTSLIHAMLNHCARFHSEWKERERIARCETEYSHYFFIECGEPDLVVKTLLQEVSRIEGAIFVVNAAEGISPTLCIQLQLIKDLSLPLRAILLTKADLLSIDALDIIERDLRERLGEWGFPTDELPLFRYEPSVQSYTARSLFELLDRDPGQPKALSKPLRLFVRQRKYTTPDGIIYRLGCLTQGQIACDDKVEVVRYGLRFTAKVHSLCMPQNTKEFLESINATDTPTEIYFAFNDVPADALLPGQIVTTPASFPSLIRYRALLYINANWIGALQTKEPRVVELRFSPIYQGDFAHLRLSIEKLLPGNYASVEILEDASRPNKSPITVEPGMFFTWRTPDEKSGPQLEGVGLVTAPIETQ